MMRVFVKAIFLYLHIVVSLVLTIAYIVPYIDPENFWHFAPLGLFFPVIFAINFFFILVWLVFKRKYLIVFLPLAAIGIFPLSKYYQINLGNVDEGPIKIMSYNVRIFDLYQWSGYPNSKQGFLSLIKDEDPDIICFQEFYHHDNIEHSYINYLKDSLGYRHFHVVPDQRNNKLQFVGLAIFSKLPVVETGEVKLLNHKKTRCLYADFFFQDQLVRVFNTHLQSIHLGYDDYSQIENKQIDLEGSKRVFDKLKNAYVLRSEQVSILKNEIGNSPYPVIVCGDFNDTPVSYVYETIASSRETLTDAFTSKGRGLGNTYAGRIPLMRIDYIFYDKTIPLNSFKTIKKTYSDHFPIVATFSY